MSRSVKLDSSKLPPKKKASHKKRQLIELWEHEQERLIRDIEERGIMVITTPSEEN